ncbi:uncharacterized protein TNCV_2299511 [Trichonephila clavipes]|nr:uncharacterized protein TNCV_2299511 [Trichonephila clavipes]
MPRFCNNTFKRRKFGSSNYSSASEDLKNGQEQPASMYKNSSSKSKLGFGYRKYVVNFVVLFNHFSIRFTFNEKIVNTRLALLFSWKRKARKYFVEFATYKAVFLLHALNNATEKVAKVSMALAAAETLSFNNGNPNVPVAIDGTWQKRGHTSLNGVVTAVSVDTGKVIDAEILSRKCSCHFNGNLHSDECSANYFGNSGGMEVEGALRIFNRSEVLHNLRYTQYLGDGDSKAYKAVLDSKTL